MSESTQAPDTSQRAIYLRIILTIGVGMLLALILVRIFAYSVGGRPEEIMSRVYESRQYLPQIAAQAAADDTLMFFGSSMTQAGFSPREFEQMIADRGVELTAYNFGFGGLNPLFQDYWARRIRDEFLAQESRLRFAFIEFNPFQTTKTRRDRARPTDDSYINMLASDAEVFDILKTDLRRGVRLFTIRYLRDSVSAEMATYFLGGFLLPRAPRTELEEDPELAERYREIGRQLNEVFEEDYPDFDGCNWCWDWQGGGTVKAERSAETLALFDEYYGIQQHPYYKENALLRRIHTTDIVDLNFDEELIVHFIRLVQVFQTFADDVQVVMLPRNSDWVKYPPEAQQRLAAVIERIERETGLTIDDHQQLEEVPNHMYGDVTHLNRYQGAVAYTQYLADRYGTRIGEIVSNN